MNWSKALSEKKKQACAGIEVCVPAECTSECFQNIKNPLFTALNSNVIAWIFYESCFSRPCFYPIRNIILYSSRTNFRDGLLPMNYLRASDSYAIFCFFLANLRVWKVFSLPKTGKTCLCLLAIGRPNQFRETKGGNQILAYSGHIRRRAHADSLNYHRWKGLREKFPGLNYPE